MRYLEAMDEAKQQGLVHPVVSSCMARELTAVVAVLEIRK